MIEFPYGIADFYTIRTQDMVYVDRTAQIRDVESLGRTLVFLRPRRFGKSLWLQTLANYYDFRRKDEFEQLFGGLAIGRRPTPRHNRYFILQWNFSEKGARGGVDELGRQLNDYVNNRIKDFLVSYSGHLPGTVTIEADAKDTFRHLLTAIRQTPYQLYLLIDEYDNFVTEVMVHDADIYRALVRTDGPFKELFKSVKAAVEGQGLERVFVTGVSPIALNDLSSGFNVAKNVSFEPELAALCGFREKEVHDQLQLIAKERGLTDGAVAEAAETMRTWYNGYCFTDIPLEGTGPACSEQELVYNPTNALYFLEHLYRRKTPPRSLHDENLRTDRGKLAFLARSSAGTGVIEKLTKGDDKTVAAPRLEAGFSVEDLTARIEQDRGAIASFLYHMGLLTLTGGEPPRLKVPNLVVQKLFLDRLLEIYLPDPGDSYEAREVAMAFFSDGRLEPLLAFFAEKFLPIFSNRDCGPTAKEPGQSGGGVNEMVIKTLFLSLLFDDTRYVTYSELELSRGYVDLCLLVRPQMRRHGYYDLLFEFKYVRRNQLGKKGLELRNMSSAAVRQLSPVAKALAEARDQAKRYSEGLLKRLGDTDLKLRCYVVVAVGLEHILGEAVGPHDRVPGITRSYSAIKRGAP